MFCSPFLRASLSVCCLLMAAAANAEPIETTGTVTAVTLYRGQALVTRTIDLKGEKGNVELVVVDLPEAIAPDSLFAEGGKGIEVRAVRFRSKAVGEEPREEVRKLDQAIEAVRQKMAVNEANRTLNEKRNQYLDQLEGFIAPTAKTELSQGVLDAESLKSVTLFSFEQRQETAAQQVKLAEEAKALSEELSLLNRQRAELTQGAGKLIREAVLFIEKQADGEEQLRLNYLVNNCGWSPSYTFRAGEDREQVQVEYNAVIHQISGESWQDVALTLSTASPALSAAGPGLAPFRVTLRSNGQQGQKPQSDQQELLSQLKNLKMQQNAAITNYQNTFNLGDNFDANWQVNDVANGLQQVELQGDASAISTLRQAGEEPSLSYAIAGTVSLNSRNDQQMVRIINAAFPSEFYHIATPVLTSYVYREAELKNESPEDLLGGPITVYLDGRFVGRGEIPTVARGQSFVVGFGADPQVRARRELADKTENVQGGNLEMQFDYRLVFENFKDEAVTLRVIDRLPNSGRKSDVRVTLGETSDAVSEDMLYNRRERPQGILRWDIELAANATGENARILTYEYRIEHDRNFELATPGSSPEQQLEQQQDFEELQRFRGKL